MKIFKFGGTSVGSPERMHDVSRIITGDDQKIVVLSAVSGTTNALVGINEILSQGYLKEAQDSINALYQKYVPFVDGLYSTDTYKNKGKAVVDEEFDKIRATLTRTYGADIEKENLAQGEIISTRLFALFLEENGTPSTLLWALDFMKIDENDEPVIPYTETALGAILKQYPDTKLFITQGYICRNAEGKVDNLKRGGSDYTASLLGAALRAEEVQIWTDIDGMHNNDPRVVKKTQPIAELSFEEAAELAYFGAKILHPTCIVPAMKYKIPVKLLNTMQPEAKGTTISVNTIDKDVKAVAAKDGIIAVKVKSTRMLLAYGFMRRVFEVFEKHRTSIDMITTSEIAVSLTIDNATRLDQIKEELKEIADVEVDYNQTIICVVGNFVGERKGIALKVFQSLKDIPIRMISYGGSRHNISILVETEQKTAALQALNIGLFGME